jgi:hypothetical protein
MHSFFRIRYLLFISILVLVISSCEVKFIKSLPISAIRDTSITAINEFSIIFPRSWQLMPKYKGTTLMGLSPTSSSIDNFRENISVQVFNLNDNFSAEEIATYLFKKSTENFDCKVLNEGYWLQENSNKFYAIEYKYSFHNIGIQSKLFCTVNDQKAYIFICTSQPNMFNIYSKVFYAVIESFRLKNR